MTTVPVPTTTVPGPGTAATTAAPTTTTTADPDETTTTTAVPDETTTTTEAERTVEDLGLPEGASVTPSGQGWALLNPGTADDLVGWSHQDPRWGHDGGIDIRLDGWSIAPGTGSSVLAVGLTVTLLGGYTLEDGQRVLSLLPAADRQAGVHPVVAWAVFPDRPAEQISHSGPVDPAIWAPVLPGEERQMAFRWDVPADATRLDVTIGNDIAYSVTTVQGGKWGTVVPPTGTAGDPPGLFGSCFTPDECAEAGMDGYDSIVLRFYREPPNGGIEFQLEVQPVPVSREGMTSADISARYEGGETWHPRRDPWEGYPGTGWAQIGLGMPLSEGLLFVRWDTPEGVALVWKTTARLRDGLFADPGWVWDTDPAEYGVYEAVLVADRLCWAYWTGVDPHGMFPEPVDTGDGTEVSVTESMVDWAVGEVCDR